MAELQQLMLAEIRTHEGCEDVTDVSIYHVTDGRAENNWEGGVVGCGSAAPDDGVRLAHGLIPVGRLIGTRDRQ
jgi:hypothetical protein